MSLGSRLRRQRQKDLFLTASDLPRSVAHPFYSKLNACSTNTALMRTPKPSAPPSTPKRSAGPRWKPRRKPQAETRGQPRGLTGGGRGERTVANMPPRARVVAVGVPHHVTQRETTTNRSSFPTLTAASIYHSTDLSRSVPRAQGVGPSISGPRVSPVADFCHVPSGLVGVPGFAGQAWRTEDRPPELLGAQRPCDPPGEPRRLQSGRR